MSKFKYGNRKTEVDGIVFDSAKEAKRYSQLKLMQLAGEITDLERQVKFELFPSQRRNNKVIERPCAYMADFVYIKDGNKVVEDVKGVKTADYIMKRKAMLFLHDIKIREVM